LSTHRVCVTTDDELKPGKPVFFFVGSGHGFCAHAGAAQSTTMVVSVMEERR
jgi:hypothetical protein